MPEPDPNELPAHLRGVASISETAGRLVEALESGRTLTPKGHALLRREIRAACERIRAARPHGDGKY